MFKVVNLSAQVTLREQKKDSVEYIFALLLSISITWQLICSINIHTSKWIPFQLQLCQLRLLGLYKSMIKMPMYQEFCFVLLLLS